VALLLILEDVGHEIRLPEIGVGCFVGIEKINHRFVQMALVSLQRNQVISFLINDLRRHFLLTAHGVQRHDAALDIEQPQQFRQHRDLVTLVRGVDRSKDDSALVAERVDDVERAVPLALATAPAALPVNRDQPFDVPVQETHPACKTVPKPFGIQRHENVAVGVFAGDAILEGKDHLQHPPLGPAGIRHVIVTLSATQQGHHRHQQDLVERVADVLTCARIG